jgi:hypothetical protein
MTTQTHTPTPLSKRMATIATRLGWSDDTEYADDYSVKQRFSNEDFMIFVNWEPDGRNGIGEVIRDFTMKERTGHLMLVHRAAHHSVPQTLLRHELAVLFSEHSKEE